MYFTLRSSTKSRMINTTSTDTLCEDSRSTFTCRACYPLFTTSIPLIIYIRMIPWADKLRSHPAYVQTAIAAAQVRPTLFISLNNQDQKFTSFSPQLYVNIHDDPSLAKAPTTSCVIFYKFVRAPHVYGFFVLIQL